jgi:hypothetical protein
MQTVEGLALTVTDGNELTVTDLLPLIFPHALVAVATTVKLPVTLLTTPVEEFILAPEATEYDMVIGVVPLAALAV